jgi:hypothetical protein
MTGHACGSHCGWCGACSADYDRNPELEPVAWPFCDECGRDCIRALSLAGVGVACSRDCLDKLAAKHEQRMRKVSA